MTQKEGSIMSKTTKRVLIATMIAFMLVAMMPLSAYASNTSVSGGGTVKPGDTVTISAAFTGKNGSIQGVTGTIEYDRSILKFKESSVAYSDDTGIFNLFTQSGEPTNSLSASFKFEALKETSGTSVKVNANDVETIDSEGKYVDLSKSSGSTSVTVRATPEYTVTFLDHNGSTLKTETVKEGGNASAPSAPSRSGYEFTGWDRSFTNVQSNLTVTAQYKEVSSQPSQPSEPAQPSQPDPEPEPEEEPEQEPIDEAIEVDVNGETLYLWRDLSSLELPNGFEVQTIEYEGEEIEGAVDEERELTLLYLTDEDGENGAFYIYDEESGEFYLYRTLRTNNRYILLQNPQGIEIPEGYSETMLELDGEEIQAWQHEDEDQPDFYLLYAMNEEGERGFYLYDQVEGTMQRFFYRTVEIEVINEVEVEREPEVLSFGERLMEDRTMLGILITLAVISLGLIAALVTMLVKKRQNGYNI